MCPHLVKVVSMFESLDKTESDAQMAFTFDGKSVSASPGMNIAAALLAAGVLAIRDTPVSGSPRGPFCMMGACYDCLVSIEGVTVQACVTPVREAMVVSRVPVRNENK